MKALLRRPQLVVMLAAYMLAAGMGLAYAQFLSPEARARNRASSAVMTQHLVLPSNALSSNCPGFGLSFSNAATTGVCQFVANSLSLYAGNNEVMRLQSTQVNVLGSGLVVANTGAPQFIQFTGRIQSNIPTANIFAPTTGGTVTLTNNYTDWIINPAGTLATLTLNMPAGANDGALQRVKITQSITALTVSGNGNTLVGGPTTYALGAGVIECQWNLATTTWYCA